MPKKRKKPQHQHAQVIIRWNDREASVDKGLACLILELWKAGINTVQSCEDGLNNLTWIQFATSRDAEKFVDIAWGHVPSDDTRAACAPEALKLVWGWQFSGYPFTRKFPLSFLRESGYADAANDALRTILMISVRFPREHLASVQNRLLWWNSENRSDEPLW